MLNAAVIGVGNMGQHHARIYSQLDTVNLVGVVDNDFKRCTEIANKYNCFAARIAEEVFSKDKIDLVSICVPTSQHKLFVESIWVNWRPHILLEKPGGEYGAQIEDLMDMKEQIQQKIMVGYLERFNPAIRKLKLLIERGIFGDILTCSFERIGLKTDAEHDTDVMTDLMVHDIDLMHYLFGNIVWDIRESTMQKNTYNQKTLAYVTESGIMGTLHANWLSEFKQRKIKIVGTKDVAEVDLIHRTIQTKDNLIQTKGHEPLLSEISYFIDCINNDIDPIPGLKEAYDVFSDIHRADDFGW